MAKMISYKKNISEELEKIRQQKNKGLKKILIAMVIAMFFARPVAPIVLAGGILYLFNMGSYSKIYGILIRKEIRGEELFDGLPDSYTILCDPHIKVEGKESQLDYVIVGPNGIFVATTNNLNGAVYGEEGEDEWRHETTRKKGEQVINPLFNPLKQVEYKVRLLDRLLDNNTLSDKIKGIVYFASPSVELNVNTKSPVFTYSEGSKKIVNFIKSYKQERIDGEKQQEIIDKIVAESSLSKDI